MPSLNYVAANTTCVVGNTSFDHVDEKSLGIDPIKLKIFNKICIIKNKNA